MKKAVIEVISLATLPSTFLVVLLTNLLHAKNWLKNVKFNYAFNAFNAFYFINLALWLGRQWRIPPFRTCGERANMMGKHTEDNLSGEWLAFGGFPHVF